MSDRRRATGTRGEIVAAGYLRLNRYIVIDHNWRCRRGEIDIIARDGNTLVFVEVRSRRSNQLGSAEESVTPAKQRRLAELAQTYLHFLEAEGKPWNGPWRIDVIALQLNTPDGIPKLNHIKNAVEGV